MFLTTLRLPPLAAPKLLPGVPWLVMAGLIQPLSMEAYNFAELYWGDPAWVRVVTLLGPLVIIGCLSTFAGITWPLIPAFALFTVPLQVVGIEYNWAYRTAFLAMQVMIVMMWWQATRQPSAWLLETWAKRIGFGFGCFGVVVCVLVQFMFPETPFRGLMPDYNPRFETSSAMAQTTGLPVTVWLMPAASMTLILAIAAFDFRRRQRRWRSATSSG